ncbi:hypothetical protein G9A89_019022 [Geosiphon pyriformis]|nr:hypothetical protein G9A89_019022 [Geosiphon pyriformis]
MLLAKSDIFKKARINELLVAKVVKCWNSGNLLNFNHLIKVWLTIDVIEASKVNGMVLNGVSLMKLIKYLLVIRKGYHKSKYCEFKVGENTTIRKAIDHHIKNFCSDKEKMIKSILECPFRKVVLDHLVIDDELVIEPNEVKLKWNGVLTNTRLIALVKTACKILFKILFNRIFLACNKFNVFHDDNFLVLKGTLTQFPIFAIGLVVENALEKNREFWLVLQYYWRFLGLFKPSLAQVYKNVRFFSNIVLRKAIMDKQFCYLVLAVLQPIVRYYIMIRKSLRAKASLPHDFPSEILYHPSLYDLKLFKQIQSEEKLVLLISFSNGHSIFGCLFDHRFLDLQVLGWFPLNPLQFPVRLYISPVNNFLTRVVKIFLENKLSLVNNLFCAFCGSSNFLMSGILRQFLYYKFVFLLKHFGVAFDPRSLVPYWFSLTSNFMSNSVSLGVGTATTTKENVLSVLDSDRFSEIHNSLLKVIGSVAAYFLAVNVGIGVKIAGLLFSTLTELQAVVLALKAKHRVEMEKAGLVEDNGIVSGLSSSVVSMLLTGVVYMLGVIESFAVRFGRFKLCCFFSDLDGDAFVIIDV